MKLLICSDLHGSLPMARLMLDLADRLRPEAVLLLGDVLYHGPRNPQPEGYAPKAAAEALTPLAPRLIALKGNCDSEVDETVLPFPLAPGFVWVLADGLRVCAVHGHIWGPHALPPLLPGDVLLSGHTHIPAAATTPDGIHLCNPGSLSLPKEGYPPSYGVLEEGIFRVFTTLDAPYLELDCRAPCRHC